MSGRRADRPPDPRFVAGWQDLIAHARMAEMCDWLRQQPYRDASAVLLWYYRDCTTEKSLAQAKVTLEAVVAGESFRSDQPGGLRKIRDLASGELAVLAGEFLNPGGWPDQPVTHQERVLEAIASYIEYRDQDALPSAADIARWGLS